MARGFPVGELRCKEEAHAIAAKHELTYVTKDEHDTVMLWDYIGHDETTVYFSKRGLETAGNSGTA